MGPIFAPISTVHGEGLAIFGDENRKHSFQLFVVVLYTCSVLYQLVSPSLAHATPNLALCGALDGDTSWYACEYLLLRLAVSMPTFTREFGVYVNHLN